MSLLSLFSINLKLCRHKNAPRNHNFIIRFFANLCFRWGQEPTSSLCSRFRQKHILCHPFRSRRNIQDIYGGKITWVGDILSYSVQMLDCSNWKSLHINISGESYRYWLKIIHNKSLAENHTHISCKSYTY